MPPLTLRTGALAIRVVIWVFLHEPLQDADGLSVLSSENQRSAQVELVGRHALVHRALNIRRRRRNIAQLDQMPQHKQRIGGALPQFATVQARFARDVVPTWNACWRLHAFDYLTPRSSIHIFADGQSKQPQNRGRHIE